MNNIRNIRIITERGASYSVTRSLFILPVVIMCALAMGLIFMTVAYINKVDTINQYKSIIAIKDAEIMEHITKYNKLADEVNELEALIQQTELTLNKIKKKEEAY